jgi:hypothetical protein
MVGHQINIVGKTYANEHLIEHTIAMNSRKRPTKNS